MTAHETLVEMLYSVVMSTDSKANMMNITAFWSTGGNIPPIESVVVGIKEHQWPGHEPSTPQGCAP